MKQPARKRGIGRSVLVACEPWHCGSASALQNPHNFYEVAEIAPGEPLLPPTAGTGWHKPGYT
jgi:hypothetical protein